ncbi:hypothetical protein [Mesorhizobium sp. f-mel]
MKVHHREFRAPPPEPLDTTQSELAERSRVSVPTRRPLVTTCERICFDRKKVNLSLVFAGQTVGIEQVEDRIWLTNFMDYDLGYFDDEMQTGTTGQPFRPKGLPMSPV